MSDQMREALENSKEFIRKWSLGEVDTDLARTLPDIMKQIDEALKSEPDTNPDDALEAFKQTQQMLGGLQAEVSDLKEIIWQGSPSHLRNQILQLPDRVKEQSLKVAEGTFAIEQKRAELAKIKSEIAFDVANDSALTNEAKRKAATEQALKARDDYKKLAADLPVFEQQLKRDEIELRHLENLFYAYRSIAGMQGVR